MSDLRRVLSRWLGPWAMICLFSEAWRRTPPWVPAASNSHALCPTPTMQTLHIFSNSYCLSVFCDKTRPMPRSSNRTWWVDLRWSSGGGQSGPKRIWLKNRTECAAGLACHVTPGGLEGEGASEPAVVIIGQLKLSVLHLIDDVLLLFGPACKNSSRRSGAAHTHTYTMCAKVCVLLLCCEGALIFWF